MGRPDLIALEEQLDSEPLSFAEEANLQDVVVANPRDPIARLRLYSILARKYESGERDASVLVPHLIELIAMAPWSSYCASVGLVPIGDPRHVELCSAWSAALRANDSDPAAIANASDFFEAWDFELAGVWILRGLALEPARFRWRLACHELLGADLGKPGCSYQTALAYFEASPHGLLDSQLSHPGLAAIAAYEAGQVDRSLVLAEAGLRLPEFGFSDDRHQAHTVRGLHLFSPDDSGAEGELLASIVPRLTSQGPSLRLARKFAEDGDFDLVLEFLRRLRGAWVEGDKKMSDWELALRDRRWSAFVNPGR